jgi:hypothetical protein
LITIRLGKEDQGAVGDAADTSANHTELRNGDLDTRAGGDEAGRAGGGRGVAGSRTRCGATRGGATRAGTSSASSATTCGGVAAGGSVASVAAAARGASHDGVGASANRSGLSGDTPLVNWGLVLLAASLDAGSNGEEGENWSGKVHCSFWSGRS